MFLNARIKQCRVIILLASFRPEKYQGNEKNTKENDFLIMFGFTMENIKENQI